MLNHHFQSQAGELRTKRVIDRPAANSYACLLEALPPLGAGNSWEDHLADWGPEDWAKLHYLHVCCGYSLSAAQDLFASIEVRGVSIEVAAVEYFDANFMPEIPAHLRLFVDYREYARTCRQEGFMVTFVFDSNEYTAIGFA